MDRNVAITYILIKMKLKKGDVHYYLYTMQSLCLQANCSDSSPAKHSQSGVIKQKNTCIM